ncbi:SulP family inorganic anion transporter [Cohnella panacarvi]|uniref:SulP family inorganic anion transporter n=1 Tax=Cohnella panacarvi TaxID=400776 RepID=UPI00047BD29A|nr:sulfate permease [Cohnella panacarvi]
MKGTGRFEGYSSDSLRKDMLSGLIVGIIAIPLGMAFAIASGVKPEYGLYTTVVAGLLISLFGGSRFQIGGPTGAFIPILFAIVLQYGYENLLIAGFMAGIMLVLMGLLRLGALIRYIPQPVTIGFTSGIAVLIFSGQIADFLGLTGIEKHENFLPNMRELLSGIGTINVYGVATSVICLLAMIVMRSRWPRLPASLGGLLVSTAVAAICYPGEVATIGSKFGDIPGTLPALHWPEISWQRLTDLIRPAFVIAMLGAVESLLSAVVADRMSNTRHDSNRELIGQGIANMAAPLFGGIPATGAIARTAANIRSGAVSPISGIVHGLSVLLVLLLFAPYASDIPLAAMAPILMIVAWNMSERREFAHMLKAKTSDSVVLVITFLLTVFFNLTVAVEVGLLLAVILFVKGMSESLKIAKMLPDPEHKHAKVKAHRVSAERDCPQISIVTVEGPLFFGAAERFDELLRTSAGVRTKVLLLRLSKMPHLDLSGESKLAGLTATFAKSGGTVLISGMQPQPLEMIRRTGLLDKIGEEKLFASTGDAINCALSLLDKEACRGCKHYAFKECAELSIAGGRKELCRAAE